MANIRSAIQVGKKAVTVDSTNCNTGHAVEHICGEGMQLKYVGQKYGGQQRTTRTRMTVKRANIAVQIPVFTENTMRRCKMCAVLTNTNSSDVPRVSNAT